MAHVEQIRNLLLALAHGGDLLAHLRVVRISHDLATLAAVPGNPSRAIGEGHDGTCAVVGAERAGYVRGLLVGEAPHAIEADERRAQAPLARRHLLGGVALCEQGRADRPHEAGVRGARHLAADVFLEGREHGVVCERAALDDDSLAEAREVRDADDLREHVLDDRAAQTGHDVIGRLAVFLLGDDRRGHEHRAAASELGRILGPEGRIGDLPRAEAQRTREVFQERPASRRASLVHEDVGHDAVVDPDGLHVLAADVEDERRIVDVTSGREGVRDGLDHMAIRMESLGEQQLAVAGCRASQDVEHHAGIRPTAGKLAERMLGDVERLSLVIGVERVDERALFVYHRELRRRGA